MGWGWGGAISSVDVSQDTGSVDGATAFSSPVGAHGPVEEFTLLPDLAYCRATSPRQCAGSPIFDAECFIYLCVT